MLEQISEKSRALFLLEFTKQLIKNSKTEDIFKLERILEEKEEERKEEIKERQSEIREKLTPNKQTKEIEELEEQILEAPRVITKTSVTRPQAPRVLRIPEPKIPAHLQYLRPIPTQAEIDLKDLNPLLNDPKVKIIECLGQDEAIFVSGDMGRKPTSITLNKHEINETIQAFSRLSKIPYEEGIFRVVYGNLVFSAIISETFGSKFIIKKMTGQRIY